MSNILIKDRDIVIPGETLAEGMDYLPGDNTYREGEKIFSKLLGLAGVNGRVIRITPLAGPYVPKVGDKIIAKVIGMTMNGFRFDTGTAYSAMLNIKDASSRFVRNEEMASLLAIDDSAVVKITKVTSQNLIDLTMKEPGLHKISGGRIVKINSQKVPRVIGKQGSMINLIKNKTGCNITVGQNGYVWIKGTPENELIVAEAVKLIEEKSHQEGLTEKMDAFLSSKVKEAPAKVEEKQ
jgi:exosome complex component RRP4